MIEKALKQSAGLTPLEFIENAIEGGWTKYHDSFPYGYGEVYCFTPSYVRVVRIKKNGEKGRSIEIGSAYEILLDPLAWKANGKVLGWVETKYPTSTFAKLDSYEVELWKGKMLQFVSTLAEDI